jgi:hypothetical protein
MKMLSRQQPVPSMLSGIPWRSTTLVKTALVN